MSAQDKYDQTFIGPASPTVEEDIKDQLKAFEFGLLFGALLEYAFPYFRAFVAYQYALGLSRIHMDDQYDAKNRVHMFSLGLAFGSSRRSVTCDEIRKGAR